MAEEASLFDSKGNRKYLNWPEREAFFKAVMEDENPANRAFCLTLFYTGCRISEALNLTGGNFDTSENTLVFRTLKRRSETVFRAVPVPPVLVRLIDDLIMEKQAFEEPLWSYSRTTAYRQIKSKMKEAKISGCKSSPKGLRHSFAVACITRNVPLTTVQKWMGHARLETTAIYLNIIGEEEKELAKRLWRKG